MEFTYITLYMPENNQLGHLGRGGHQLSMDLIDWLHERVGNRCPSNLDWYGNLDNQMYQWHYAGLDHDPNGRLIRVFKFKQELDAMLFKLTWSR